MNFQRSNRAAAVIFFAFFVFCGSSQPNQANSKTAVIEKLTSARIERIFKELNLKFKEIEELTDAYIVEHENIKFVFEHQEDVLEASIFFSDLIATTSRINEWNRNRRFFRAISEKDKSLKLYGYHLLKGGVTEENIKSWIASHLAMSKEVKQHFTE